MKIAICGSMSFARQMLECQKKLEKLGHEVYLPDDTERYAQDKTWADRANKMASLEGARRKIEHDLIRRHFKLIKKSDATLIVNCEKAGIKNYIGGNTFLEMGFAHVLNKKIYLLNPIPKSLKLIYQELVAMKPVVIKENLDLIK